MVKQDFPRECHKFEYDWGIPSGEFPGYSQTLQRLEKEGVGLSGNDSKDATVSHNTGYYPAGGIGNL